MSIFVNVITILGILGPWLWCLLLQDRVNVVEKELNNLERKLHAIQIKSPK